MFIDSSLGEGAAGTANAATDLLPNLMALARHGRVMCSIASAERDSLTPRVPSHEISVSSI
ncbi:MAG: hypothetical protein EBU85_00225 [Actinobacteria bacterium]|nr:hypothetical protein [Actinomycetota bacterium]